MLDRLSAGEIPAKPHTALTLGGTLCFEHCLTREGFDGAYSILYHRARPHAYVHLASCAPQLPTSSEARALRRRHFRTNAATLHTPVLFGPRVSIGIARIAQDDPRYCMNSDADQLLFIREGGGTLRSAFGDLTVDQHDYVCIPRGVLYRWLPRAPIEALRIECRDLHIPKQFRNALGQLRMDAPYSHRDFKRPQFQGARDEGLRELAITRHGAEHVFSIEHSPLDCVGFDGTVYPWAFPILAFQPRVSSVHLPPTWHGTFACDGALICSFVPRPVDFHKDAIPCPYPHSSVDVDEVLYYVSGVFASHTNVEPASITLHPAGIPHGPQPGLYEASRGQTHTDALAVMLDCYDSLQVSSEALVLEDASYDLSFSR